VEGAVVGSRLARLRRLLWHPHEKLWNWELVERVRSRFGRGPVGQVLVVAIIAADSVLLALRVVSSRARRRPSHVTEAASTPRVLYIDCGVHKKGEQIRWMQRWFAGRYELHVLGFEAGAEQVRAATEELADLERVRLHHVALVGPDYEGDEVRFYKTGGDGKGDSLFSERGAEYEVVPARRLSQVLLEEGYDLDKMPVILRMNIEGAEQFVIEDVIAAGLDRSIDGYYGMWDDLSKMDPGADERFRQRLRSHGISSVTFNDRDLVMLDDRALSFAPRNLLFAVRKLTFRLRRHVIRSDIEASIEAGLGRCCVSSETGP
jgi:FkbM family methyltransferase